MKNQCTDIIATIDSLFPKTKQALLELFFSTPEESYYLSDIFKRVGGGRSTVQQTLASLTGSGILKAERKGKYLFYQANRNGPFFSEFVSIVNKILAAKIRNALDEVSGIEIAFIYGSVAKGEANARSDIDLMIIVGAEYGDVTEHLYNLRLKLNRVINKSVYSIKEIKERLSVKNHFITRVLEGDKVFVKGDDSLLQQLITND